MKFEEIEHKVEMHRPTFLCDSELDIGRKQLPHPLPNCSHSMLIVGRPGSGKSSFIYSMLAGQKKKLYNKLFKKVHYVCPEGSLKSIKGGLKNHQRLYHELDEETITSIIEDCEKVAEKTTNNNSCIVLDDMASKLNGEALSKLKTIFFNRRHMHASIWVVSQTYRGSLPYEIRRSCGYLCFWKSPNSSEMNAIYDELISGFMIKKDFEELYRYVFQDKFGKHTFMFVDLIAGKIYRVSNEAFHEIKLSE